MKNRVLIVTNDRKSDAERLRALFGSVRPRIDEIKTVTGAVRAVGKNPVDAIVLIVPPGHTGLIDDVKALRSSLIPLFVYTANDAPPEFEVMVKLGVVETVSATASDAELGERLKRFVQRNTTMFQTYDEATRSGGENAGYTPMDDESTCWFCIEQGKASIEHGNFESAEKWLHLALRVDPDHEQGRLFKASIAHD